MKYLSIAIAMVLVTLIVCITVYNIKQSWPTDPIAQRLREANSLDIQEKILNNCSKEQLE